MKTTDLIDNDSLRDDIPDFAPGDELKVHVRVVEGGKERVQVFQGNVIKRQGSGLHETYTVRKLSYGVGVERTFPVHAPTVQKIEVTKRGDVRRAKLYYLRDRIGKAAKVREKRSESLTHARADRPRSDWFREASPARSIEVARGRWGEARPPPLGSRIASSTGTGDRPNGTSSARSTWSPLDDLIVFCEVKARRSDRFRRCGACRRQRKAGQIRRVAGSWMRRRGDGRVGSGST